MLSAEGPLRPRDGHALKCQNTLLRGEVRLVIIPPAVVRIIEVVVLNADNQKNQPRLVTIETLLKKQILLVSAVRSHAKIINIPFRMPGLQSIGETFGCLNTISPNERVTKTDDRRLGVALMFGTGNQPRVLSYRYPSQSLPSGESKSW